MWLKYLIEAIKNNDDEQILYVTKNIANQVFNEIEINGSTALHWLAWGGYREATKILLDAKPEIIKLLDNDGFSALHYAALSGSVKTMEILLKAKPELLDIATNKGSTALKAACLGEHWQAIIFLQNYNTVTKNEKIAQIKTQFTYSDQYDFISEPKIELVALTNEKIEI